MYISLGYIAGVFGNEGPYSKCCICFAVVVLAQILCGIGTIVAKREAIRRYSNKVAVIENNAGQIWEDT